MRENWGSPRLILTILHLIRSKRESNVLFFCSHESPESEYRHQNARYVPEIIEFPRILTLDRDMFRSLFWFAHVVSGVSRVQPGLMYDSDVTKWRGILADLNKGQTPAITNSNWGSPLFSPLPGPAPILLLRWGGATIRAKEEEGRSWGEQLGVKRFLGGSSLLQ